MPVPKIDTISASGANFAVDLDVESMIQERTHPETVTQVNIVFGSLYAATITGWEFYLEDPDDSNNRIYLLSPGTSNSMTFVGTMPVPRNPGGNYYRVRFVSTGLTGEGRFNYKLEFVS